MDHLDGGLLQLLARDGRGLGGNCALRLQPSGPADPQRPNGPTQDGHRSDREILVCSFDDAFPGGKFPLVSPPAHPFRFGWGIGPCAQAFPPELPVQRRGSALKTTETVLALAAVSKAVSLPAPKMGSAVRQKEFCSPADGHWAKEPPASAAIGRGCPRQPNAVADDMVAVLPVACRVDQFDEAIPFVSEVDGYHPGTCPHRSGSSPSGVSRSRRPVPAI